MMNSSIPLWLANHFPQLGGVRRYVWARLDAWQRMKPSYSQHGEDTFIHQFLRPYRLQDSIYIDVGANHPTRISNTYLLYRHGMRGVVIEPNRSLLALYSLVRPLDVAIGVGCGSSPTLGKFFEYSTPVLSTFAQDGAGMQTMNSVKLVRTAYLPILPLDVIMAEVDLPHTYVAFLSIDTEGHDYAVLCGAVETLARTLLLCIEVNDSTELHKYLSFLQIYQFREIGRFGCNVICKNQDAKFDQYIQGVSG